VATFPTSPRPSSVSKVPAFSTLIADYGNTIEQRIQLNSTERYSFELSFSVKEVSSMDVFIEFFLARKGSYESFYFQNTAEAYRAVVWATGTAYSVGDIVRPVAANGRSYRCTSAGTSGGSEPTWGTAVNGTTGDGGVTWTENTYTVRFVADQQKSEYFYRTLMNQGTITLITCSE
jgi:phage-related protein